MGDSAFTRRTRYWRAGCTETCPSGSGGGGWIPLVTGGWPPTSCATSGFKARLKVQPVVENLLKRSTLAPGTSAPAKLANARDTATKYAMATAGLGDFRRSQG